MKKSIAARLLHGDYTEAIVKAFRAYRVKPNSQTRAAFVGSLLEYLIGYKTTERLWSIIAGKAFLYEGDANLYHWTAAENIESIRKNGLVCGKGVVYITDDPEYIARSGYFKWKQLHHKLDFVLVEIDVKALNHKIFYSHKKHELIVDKVPAECIKIKEAPI